MKWNEMEPPPPSTVRQDDKEKYDNSYVAFCCWLLLIARVYFSLNHN